MNVRSYVFLKKVTLSKILSLVLNLLTQFADLLLRSGDEGALLQFMKKDNSNLISSPVMGRFCGRELCLWSGVPASSAKLP